MLVLIIIKFNTMKNYKTPIEDIFFRSSKVGIIAGGLMRHGLTAKQREDMENLEKIKTMTVGLSEKQQADLDAWKTKREEGGILTPKQMESLDEYESRLTRFKTLTPNQEATLQKLKEQNARPPELSQGAKTAVKQTWLKYEKGFEEEVTDKKLRKGIQAEEDAINLISFVDNVMYIKNEKRISIDNLSGECDVITEFKNMETDNPAFTVDAIVIDDTKCSWNPRTFMSAGLTTDYEWQGRAYLYLYDADIFRLRHCLVDCPPDVLQEEYKKYCFQHNIIDDSLPKYQPLIEQFNRNFLYEDSGLYTKEERVKTFTFERDFELEAILLESVKLAVKYYQTITLNMI